MTGRHAHWAGVWTTRDPAAVSWFEPEAAVSLELIAASGVAPDAPIVDVGAGASTLVDGLLARGFTDVTVLDVAEAALAVTRARLSTRAQGRVSFVASDVTRWQPSRAYALWHDRAVFHFLVDEPDRAAYLATLARALRPGGAAVIATFADDGPERCSGLPVRRYDEATIAATFAPVLRVVASRRVVHRTPAGGEQRFLFARLARDA